VFCFLAVPEDSKLVVVECFANFLCDDVRDAGENPNVVKVMDQSLVRHFEILSDFCKTHPNLVVAVGFPLLRLQPTWFESNYQNLIVRFEFEFDTTAPTNMKLLRSFGEELIFEDSVHLPSDLGVRYVNHLVEEGWHLFDSTELNKLSLVQRSSPDFDVPVQVSTSDLLTSDRMSDLMKMSERKKVTGLTEDHFQVLLSEIKKNNVTDRVQTIESRLDKVEKTQLELASSADLAIAKLYEDQDFSKNSSRENRVSLGSLYLKDPLPSDRPGQLELLKQRVSSLISDLFKQESNRPEVLGVSIKSAGLTQKGAVKDFDIIFKSPAQALSFRKVLGVESRKAGVFKGLYVSNCVTHSTKVRIDIMTAIARKLSSQTTHSFCQSFISRPVLHVKPKNGSGASKVYTFVDAVREFGSLLTEEDLSPAYRRAGSIYSGMLTKFFVVLKEKSNQPVRSLKRPRDSESGFPKSKIDRAKRAE